MKIMAVDDSQISLRYLHKMLVSLFPQHEILSFDDPKEVMPVLQEETIDVLLLDIMMPDINGKDLLRNIRKNERYDDMQIIMVTALDDDDTLSECFAQGANDYMIKPVNQTELISRVRNALINVENRKKMKALILSIKEHNMELRQMNVKLQQAQASLVHSEKMAAIGQLAAGVAHEINNPIGYVGSNLETLNTYLNKVQRFFSVFQEFQQKTDQEASGEECGQLIHQMENIFQTEKIALVMEDLPELIADSRGGVQKVAQIVGTMREFSRSDHSDQKEWCSINHLISQSILMLENESKYVADVLFDDRQTVDAYCNPVQVGQVLINIILNAVQAIQDVQEQPDRGEKGKINVHLEKKDEMVTVTIADNGPGIPEKNHSKLFDPFFTTKDVGKGTGLGLSISYDLIVNKHQGSLSVTSEPGSGSVFTICFPVQPKSGVSQ